MHSSATACAIHEMAEPNKARATSPIPSESAASIYGKRIGNRRNASNLIWLDDLMREGALDLGHIDNDMYRAILEDRLSVAQMNGFLRSYYWGSGYGFQRIVLPAAAKRKDSPTWTKYIKSIIREENCPTAHCEIFKSFMSDLDVEVGEMTAISQVFIGKMREGYGRDLAGAMGYAMGIETEADFQIALLHAGLSLSHPLEVGRSAFFPIHLAEDGEEMHARETCMAIENILAEGHGCQGQVEAGFRQAIVDTRDYMCAIHADVVGMEKALCS